MTKEIRELPLDSLFEKLQNLMSNLVKDVDSVIEDNKVIGMSDIRDLREHINSRLSKREEIHDNEKILRLLNLFSEDKAVLEIIKEDAEEWVNLLEAIEDNIRSSGVPLTMREKKEIKEIRRLTTEIKSLIRKD